jgi:hypothetical protein
MCILLMFYYMKRGKKYIESVVGHTKNEIVPIHFKP